MPGPHNFEHLPLLRRYQGKAKIRGSGRQSPQTKANRLAYEAHSRALHASATSIAANWQAVQAHRQNQNLPVIQEGVPVLLKVDPGLDLDVLRDKFAFEIVAEQEEGYVIVASRDIQLGPFVEMVNAFSVRIHGSATVASVHTVFDDPSQQDRLRRILSERLFNEWSTIHDEQFYVLDIGVSCTGTQEIPPSPERGATDSDREWAHKENIWAQAREDAYAAWDEIKEVRESEIIEFARFYNAEILSSIDGEAFNAAVLPDSFTIRLRIIGAGYRDIVLNYPFIFEVVEPEDITLPQRAGDAVVTPEAAAAPTPPPCARFRAP